MIGKAELVLHPYSFALVISWSSLLEASGTIWHSVDMVIAPNQMETEQASSLGKVKESKVDTRIQVQELLRILHTML